jgi:hypothetical protein
MEPQQISRVSHLDEHRTGLPGMDPPRGDGAGIEREVAAAPPPVPCRVCGFAELRWDVALDSIPLLLSECPRCTHRATHPLPTRQPDSTLLRGGGVGGPARRVRRRDALVAA